VGVDRSGKQPQRCPRSGADRRRPEFGTALSCSQKDVVGRDEVLGEVQVVCLRTADGELLNLGTG
jgi:hypothetical protein